MGWLTKKAEAVKQAPPGFYGDYLTFGVGTTPFPDSISSSNFETNAYLGYDKNEIVYSCITEKATSAPEARLRVYKPGSQEPWDSHPLRKLIENPNPIMTEFELFELTIVHLDLAGSAFWWVVRDIMGRPVELWPMRPDFMRVIDATPNGIQWGYVQRGVIVDLGVGNIIQFKYPNPVDPYFGQAPMRPATRAVALDNEATDFVSALLHNHAVPGVVITNMEEVDQKVAEKLKAKWRESYTGSHRGEPVVLQPGMDVKPLGLSLRDLEFPDLRGVSESRICGVFGVHPTLIASWTGMKNGALGDMAAAKKGLWEETLMPLQRRMVDAIAKVLLPAFIGPGKSPIELRFDKSEVLALAEEESAKWTRATAALAVGGITVADFKRTIGLPVLDGDDVYYVPSGVIVTRDASGAQQNLMTGQQQPAGQAPNAQQPADQQPADNATAGKSWSVKAFSPALRTKHEAKFRSGLGSYFASYGMALRTKAQPRRDRWDASLAHVLTPIGTEASAASGSKAAEKLGSQYDVERTRAWQEAHALIQAKAINNSFEEEIRAADDVDAVQARYAEDGESTDRLAVGLVTTALSWGVLEAGRQSGDNASKQWVTGENPRASHAGMNGETVGIDEPFSNGAMWPGDPAAGADESAGCNCGVEIVVGEKSFRLPPGKKEFNPDQPRDDAGRWSSDGGGGAATATEFRPISAAEARGDSRAVTRAEFQRLAQQGQDKLDAMRENASPPAGLDQHWDEIKSSAYDEAQKSWGGVTVDAHTGQAVESNADRYALTIKSGGESVSVPENASADKFNSAMDEARAKFDNELQTQGAHLGVFHDDDNNRIDIDPVLVVNSINDVETIGAATHAIGGAYNFADGNGYWPPHVQG